MSTFEKLMDLFTDGSVILSNKYKDQEVSIHTTRDGYNRLYFVTLVNETDGANISVTESQAIALIQNDHTCKCNKEAVSE